MWPLMAEVPVLIWLSSRDITYNEIGTAVSVFILVVPLSLILFSYSSIAQAVLRINSAKVWRKALESAPIISQWLPCLCCLPSSPKSRSPWKEQVLWSLLSSGHSFTWPSEIHPEEWGGKEVIWRIAGEEQEFQESALMCFQIERRLFMLLSGSVYFSYLCVSHIHHATVMDDRHMYVHVYFMSVHACVWDTDWKVDKRRNISLYKTLYGGNISGYKGSKKSLKQPKKQRRWMR